jgi:hypothetical protein
MDEKLIDNDKEIKLSNNKELKYTKTTKSAAHNIREEEDQIDQSEPSNKKIKKHKKIKYEEEFKDDFNDNIRKDTEYNTLNESVCQTLKRDIVRIWNKLSVVIIPVSNKEKDNELRHWDLWGPFLFCILLGL